jgi:hypothetical protein
MSVADSCKCCRQLQVLQTAQLNRVPAEVGTQQVSRIPVSQGQPDYKPAIPVAVDQLLPGLLYPMEAKINRGP